MAGILRDALNAKISIFLKIRRNFTKKKRNSIYDTKYPPTKRFLRIHHAVDSISAQTTGRMVRTTNNRGTHIGFTALNWSKALDIEKKEKT